MKFIIVLAAVSVAAVSATKTHYGAGPALVAAPVALGSTGTSSQFRSEDNYGNYNFGYDEAHATGSTSRREESNNGVRRGSYSLSDADGRRRVVYYTADATGFHATIETNEPGVEPKDPADVLINKAAPVVIAAAPAAPLAPVRLAPLPAPIPAPLPAWAPAPVQLAGPAPLPLPLPVPAAPVSYGYKSLPLALPSPTYSAPAYTAPTYAAPRPIAVAAPVVVEPATPRAFSYSFGASHQAPIAVAAGPLPIQAPIYQQKLEY